MRKLWKTSKVKMGEESFKLVTSRTQKRVTLNVYIYVQGGGGGVEKSVIDTYVRMDDPKNMFWNIFCALVWPSTLEHYRQQGKCYCFLPS